MHEAIGGKTNMAKNQIVLSAHVNADWLTLPDIGPEWTEEEQTKFLGILTDRLNEIREVVGISSVKSSSKQVSGKGTGKLEYATEGGDWRDGVLDMLTNAVRVAPWVSVKVDVTRLASGWAAKRRTKKG